jgi:hypothetical protein
MTGPQSRLDPELLQARWVLGSLDAEELVSGAMLALEQGFDGSALRQLAGLEGSAMRDLGALPERAFVEMGLKRCDNDQAVSLLLARGPTLTSPTVCVLVEAFPEFSTRWRKHLADWGGEPAGSYNDMAKFVHFVVEDLYEKELTGEVRRAFELLETLFVEGDQPTRDLIGLGFLETLQNVASWRPYGNRAFEQFLGPMSTRCWKEIQRQWSGKSSLMDVIRSERRGE